MTDLRHGYDRDESGRKIWKCGNCKQRFDGHPQRRRCPRCKRYSTLYLTRHKNPAETDAGARPAVPLSQRLPEGDR